MVGKYSICASYSWYQLSKPWIAPKQKSNLITSSGSTPSMTPHCPPKKKSLIFMETLHWISSAELLIHPSCILAPATLNSPLHTWAFYTTPAELPFPVPLCSLLPSGICSLKKSAPGSVPKPQPQTNSSLRPVRNLATQQDGSRGWASETASVFTASAGHWHYCLRPCPVRSVVALDSPRARNLLWTIHERSRLSAPYENHPETIPPAMKEIVFHNTSPWVPKWLGRGLPYQYNMKIHSDSTTTPFLSLQQCFVMILALSYEHVICVFVLVYLYRFLCDPAPWLCLISVIKVQPAV